jgi:hypothetical protein
MSTTTTTTKVAEAEAEAKAKESNENANNSCNAMSESYDVHRGLYPALKHQEFVQLCSIRNASIPGAPTQRPLATDDSLPDSQKARYKLV